MRVRHRDTSIDSHLCKSSGVHRTDATPDPDSIRAMLINSARWPSQLGNTEDQLRLFGYGVPQPKIALDIGGPICTILIEDSVRIGNVHFFRVPWPSDLFERSPEQEIRVSVTLAYRAPIRKTNRKYRGTVLEWKLSKRGESFSDFTRRSLSLSSADDSGEDDPDEDSSSPIADWSWVVKTNRRKRGTAQKDWFEAPASFFVGDELYLSVIGRRGWITSQQQRAGWYQRYAVAITIEVLGANIPIHERIEQMIHLQVAAQRAKLRVG